MSRKKYDYHAVDNFMEYGIDLDGRWIHLDDDVDDVSVGRVIKALQLMDRDTTEKPIRLLVNSFGGSVYDGLALYDAIRNCKSEIHTYGYGKIMSMAVHILIAGDKRYMSPRSTIMVHEISDFVYGQLEDIKIQVKEAERLERVLIDIFVERTNIKDRDYWEKLKKETYFTADQSIEKGIINEIDDNEY